jgi:aminopeptidase N
MRRAGTCIFLTFAIWAFGNGQLPENASERHEYRLLNLMWDVSIDPLEGAISGIVTNTVTASVSNPLLVFDCARLQVSAAEVNGKAAKFEGNDRVVVIHSPTSLLKGAHVDVTIHYSGKPEAGLYFVPAERAFPARTPIVYTQGEMIDNRYWLPTYDEPEDKATSEAFIRVPTGWKALSNGTLQGVEHLGSQDVWHWKLPQPHSTYLNSFVAGPYDEIKDGSEPVPVSFWVPTGLDDWGEAAFGGTDRIVRFYSKLTGVPYPWPKYSQSAVADFMFGGMENVTCTTQSITALHPKSVEPNVDSTGLVAHELAHQWFGDLVTLQDWSHTWLNEGWASFLPSFWDRERIGSEAFDLDRLGTFEGGLGAAHGEPNRPVVWTKYAEPIDMFTGLAYSGGASRLFMLMHQVGEERFWPAVTHYLNEFAYKNATTDQFFSSMSKSLGANLDEFKKEWFYTAGAPSLTLTKDGEATVLRQGGISFHFPLDVWLVDRDGTIEKRHMDVAATASVEIPEVRGRLILLDPEVWLMADLTYDLGYQPSDWQRLYSLAPNAAEKGRIIDSEFSHFSPSSRESLARGETSEGLLERMMPSIGNADYLLDMSRNSDPRLTAAAARAMSSTYESPKLVDRLRDLWISSGDDEVRLAALDSLLRITQDRSLAEKALNTDSYNDSFRIDGLDWLADHQPDVARDQALAELSGPASEPLKLESIRVLGRVKDKLGERRAFNALVALLTERSNSPLRAAIGALGEYGDKAAIPLIEPKTHHSLHFVRRDAEAALARLRG